MINRNDCADDRSAAHTVLTCVDDIFGKRNVLAASETTGQGHGWSCRIRGPLVVVLPGADG
jgi:hypothetical protein